MRCISMPLLLECFEFVGFSNYLKLETGTKQASDIRSSSAPATVNLGIARSGLCRRCDGWLVQPLPGWSLSVRDRSAIAERFFEGRAFAVLTLQHARRWLNLHSRVLSCRLPALQPLHSRDILDRIRPDTLYRHTHVNTKERVGSE